MTMVPAGQIARRFPLVARPRPPCPPLTERVQEISDLARAAAGQTGARSMSLAATAHNKAALILSDCGLPDLARSLCHRQLDVYLRARPLDAPVAKHALEPVVNLARLLIRSHDADRAYQLLDTLYHAVRFKTGSTIDGRRITFRDFTVSDEDHRALCQWVWAALLADGTRALAAAGRWDHAQAHVHKHAGIGQRLLDGRQVAILARWNSGHPDSALSLLQDSTTLEPWERAVAACLAVLCLRSRPKQPESAVAAMAEHYLALEPDPELLVFRVRLGLTVMDLAAGATRSPADQAATRIISEAIECGDGYAAREVLAHDGCRARLNDIQEHTLATAMQSSGLACGEMPENLMSHLLAAVKASEAATARNLAGRLGPARLGERGLVVATLPPSGIFLPEP
jgi:hypothetical protein